MLFIRNRFQKRRVVFLLICGAILLSSAACTRKSDDGGPEDRPAILDAGQGRLQSFLTEIFSISPDQIKDKIYRILVVAAVWVGALFLMRIVKRINRWMIYSDWGPLRYIFQRHTRAFTINSLVLNLFKYAVYFTALGYILSELGVDYKVYLTSLSLIGIAVGFGSQGLVQDVVTGFFIIFENQFAVGDMVEITGQIGIVDEMGLRTTRIRNYVGESLIYPNRNITVVGLFTKGVVEASVDVAIAEDTEISKATSIMENLSIELRKQYPGIIRNLPRIADAIALETGEIFLRVVLYIWPQQQWIIESQLMPRLREIFRKEGITIPGDRVSVFYHMHIKKQAVPTSRRKLSNLFRRRKK